jgi:hypothetical protein
MCVISLAFSPSNFRLMEIRFYIKMRWLIKDYLHFFFLIKDNYLVENRPIKRENIIISHGNWLLRLELAFFSFPNLYSFWAVVSNCSEQVMYPKNQNIQKRKLYPCNHILNHGSKYLREKHRKLIIILV